jgi:hypothetical protein
MADAVIAVSNAEVVKQVKEIVAEYRTRMTLRQIYYRLVSRNSIPNNLNSYKNLSRILVGARERGEIPAHIMEDRGRSSVGGDFGYDNPVDFATRRLQSLEGCAADYTREMWANQDEYIEVWVEKDALSRLVSSACGGYRVKTCVGRGYSSYTYVSDAVDRFVERQDKACTVIYLGDFDPSGLDITRDLGRRLAEYGADHVKINRIALSKDQIKQFSLPPAPVKTSDARSEKFIEKHGKDVWELDALEPNVLQETIQREITKHIDGDAWAETRERIERERSEVSKTIKQWFSVLRANGVEVGE